MKIVNVKHGARKWMLLKVRFGQLWYISLLISFADIPRKILSMILRNIFHPSLFCHFSFSFKLTKAFFSKYPRRNHLDSFLGEEMFLLEFNVPFSQNTKLQMRLKFVRWRCTNFSKYIIYKCPNKWRTTATTYSKYHAFGKQFTQTALNNNVHLNASWSSFPSFSTIFWIFAQNTRMIMDRYRNQSNWKAI